MHLKPPHDKIKTKYTTKLNKIKINLNYKINFKKNKNKLNYTTHP